MKKPDWTNLGEILIPEEYYRTFSEPKYAVITAF